MSFLAKNDPAGVFSFCCGENELDRAEQWISLTEWKDEYFKIYLSFHDRISYDPERECWFKYIDVYSAKEALACQTFKNLRLLTQIGVTEPALCLLVTAPFWTSSEKLQSFINRHGEAAVAKILNILIEYHDIHTLLYCLDDVFSNEEYNNPYKALCETTGVGYFPDEY